ncbi:hypothetical protein PRJ_4821 [Pseudomonas sp. XWY-1]|nr:hypothetical protein PRJ_4821 [Pseudomonas sp. XWY-1]
MRCRRRWSGINIDVACAGLFAGEPAPTQGIALVVGAGLPVKGPAQAIQNHQANNSP